MSFESFFTPYIEKLYRTAFRWTQHEAKAEDLLHDLAVKLMCQEHLLQKLERPLPWMTKVMYRIFVDQYRRDTRTSILSDQDLNEEQEAELAWHQASDGPDQIVQDDQLSQRLLDALSTLDIDQRVAFTLYELEGFRLQEIAEVQEIAIGTVKSRIFRAKSQLKKLLPLELFSPLIRVKGRGVDHDM